MSLRTRRLGLLGSVLFVAAACSPAGQPGPATPGASPGGPGAASPGATAGEQNIDQILFGYQYQPQQGQPGGSIIYADWQAPEQLNPYYSNAFKNTQVFAITLRPLITISHDGHWMPDLLTKVPRLSDGSVKLDEAAGGAASPAASPGATGGFSVELELRPNLKWSDGQPLTLNDWKYTVDWINDPNQAGLALDTTGWKLIDRVDVASDGLKATMHFKSGYAGYYGILNYPPLPAHYMKTIPVKEAAEKSYPLSPAIANSVVSGPFKYQTAVKDDQIVMVPNEHWNSCLGEGCTPHKPYLERIVHKSFPQNKEGMIAAFLTGEIDVPTNMLQGDYAAVSKVDPNVGKALIEAAWEYEHLDLNQAGQGPGKGHPALKDPKVVQAIKQSIDKEALYKQVYPGVPLPEGQGCTNAPNAKGIYWRNTDVQCPQFDREAAKRLLDEAGWKDTNNDGVRDKNGVELALLHYHSGAPFRETGGTVIASQLKEVGIKLTSEASEVIFDGWTETTPETKGNLTRGTYDTAEFAYVLTFDIYGDYVGYHSTQIPTAQNQGAGNNTLRLADPEMDAALDRLKSAVDPAQQLAEARKIQELYVTKVPEVVLYDRSGVRGVTNELQNFFRNPSTASDMWNVEDWYVTGQ